MAQTHRFIVGDDFHRDNRGRFVSVSRSSPKPDDCQRGDDFQFGFGDLKRAAFEKSKIVVWLCYSLYTDNVSLRLFFAFFALKKLI